MKAIETRYAGYRFRSRLEARWAVFFQTLGLKWEYEPEGFDLGFGDWYLPDFRVHYPGRGADEARDHWFEVKPRLDLVPDADWSRLLKFEKAAELSNSDFVVLDGPPDMRAYLSPSWVTSGMVDAETAGREHNIARAMAGSRYGYVLWSGKGRLWTDEERNAFPSEGASQASIEDDAHMALERAVDAARAARFEKARS